MEVQLKLVEAEKITVGPGQFLAVRLPETADEAMIQAFRKGLRSILGDDAGKRVVIYAGDVKFDVVDIKDANGH